MYIITCVREMNKIKIHKESEGILSFFKKCYLFWERGRGRGREMVRERISSNLFCKHRA